MVTKQSLASIMKASEKQLSGAFYTPTELANHLISRCPHKAIRAILDPACGEFALLNAAHVKYRARIERLVGCDKRLITTAHCGIRFIHSDFFEYHPKKQYDLIVENPPYIKANRCDSLCRTWMSKHKQFSDIDKRADLWVYFLLKSITHLRMGGTLAAILPWAFIQANYSSAIRRILLWNFESIHVQVLTKSYFADTTQKVVLLWLFGKGKKNKDIKICISDELEDRSKTRFADIDESMWVSGLGIRIPRIYKNSFICKDVRPLSDLCDIKIGLVPGATSFFIKTLKQMREENVSEEDCQCIVTSAHDVGSLILQEKTGLKRLLTITDEDAEKYRELIKDGEKNCLHERRHCKNRKCWYSISVPNSAPDAFFTYRSSTIPILTINKLGVWCTNALHAIFFHENDVSANQIQWIQISLLSAFSLLDIELLAKTYGKDVLKIEPNALKKVKVYCPDKPIDEGVVKEIDALLKSGDRYKVVIIATQYIMNDMTLSERQKKHIMNSYNRLRSQRALKKIQFEDKNDRGPSLVE